MRRYVPSPQELTDTRKQRCCPCREETPRPETYDERARRIRSLLTRGCCPYWTTDDISAGSITPDVSDGTILQLTEGVPVEKPLLVRYAGSALTVLFPAKYKIQPASSTPVFEDLQTGSPVTIYVTWTQVCPTPAFETSSSTVSIPECERC